MVIFIETFKRCDTGKWSPHLRRITCAVGTTVKEVLNTRCGIYHKGNWLIRVNGKPITEAYMLFDMDKISLVPHIVIRTETISGSGTVSGSGISGHIDSYEWNDNNVDPGLLELEEKVKKLME